MKTASESAVAAAEGGLSEAKTVSPIRPRRHWRRRILVSGVFLAVLALFHAPILGFIGELLVVDDPLVPTDAVVVMGRSGPYRAVPIDEVTELYQKHLVREVLLIEDRSSRIVKAGIVPTLESVMTRELAKRNVSNTALTTLASEYRSGSEMTGVLGDWLKKHPDAHVTVLCDQFFSRNDAYLARQGLEATEYNRIHWHAIADKRHDVTNWWHTRHGIVEVVSAYVSLLHAYVIGEPSEPAQRWDADEFERSLRERAVP
jgi:hypothetical protein